MIIVLKKFFDIVKYEKLVNWLKIQGVEVKKIEDNSITILVIMGDCCKIDIDCVRAFSIVESIKKIDEPYKLVSRKFKDKDTIINVGEIKIGGDNFTIIAGPCTVESEKQIIEIAKSVKESGGNILRGGAFKPRTSPYTFQGLKDEGLKYLIKAKAETGLPIVSEIMSINQVDLFRDVDIIQIGARDMQNYELLKEVGKTNKPVLLKRGFCNTVDEWLMSAEYIMSEGAKDIILCERGIRTFETLTRNTLDLSVVPLLKEITHLPIIVDPSHASGLSRLVKPLSLASVCMQANGVMIEVHNSPEDALCDGAQSVDLKEFSDICESINNILPVCSKKF